MGFMYCHTPTREGSATVWLCEDHMDSVQQTTWSGSIGYLTHS